MKLRPLSKFKTARNFASEMAARKPLLAAPSEFAAKQVKIVSGTEKGILKDGRTSFAREKVLLPPSKYVTTEKTPKLSGPKEIRPKGEATGKSKTAATLQGPAPSQASVKKIPVTPYQRDKVVKLLQSGPKPDSDKLLKEIKSCKEQNNELHQTLTKHIQSLSKMTTTHDREKSKPGMENMNALLSQMQQIQEQNSKFHDLLQHKIHRQEATVEKVTEQFLDHQSDLSSENERLSRKLQRLTDEHKDVKSYLEKQLETKEKECHNVYMELDKLEKVLDDYKVAAEKERMEFQDDIKSKEKAIKDLQLQLKDVSQEKDNIHYRKEMESKLATKKSAEEIISLNEMIVKLESDLKLKEEENREKDLIMKQSQKRFETQSKQREAELESFKYKLEAKQKELEKVQKDADISRVQSFQAVEEMRLKSEAELETCKEKSRRKCADLKMLLEKEKEEQRNFKGKYQANSQELEGAKQELQSLHAYVAEKDLEANSKHFKIKLKSLEDENGQLTETCQALESAIELLNVRLLSLNNVIKIQESEIARDGLFQAGDKSSNLLSKWRDKVYELLVQLKSHQIMENEDVIRFQKKLHDYHSQLQEYQSKLALTENQLVEKSAEVDMKSNEICTLSKDLSAVKQKLTNAQEGIEQYKTLFESVKKHFDMVSKKVSLNFKNVEDSLVTFKAFDSRLGFANKRLQMIHEYSKTTTFKELQATYDLEENELFNRRNALWKSKLDKVGGLPDEEHDSEEENEGHSFLDQNSLLREIENLTKERQLLLNQIKSDTEKLTSIQKDLETKYEGKLMTRDQRIQELELELESKVNDNTNMRSELEKLKEENRLLTEEIDALKFDLRRVESNFEKELTSKLEQERDIHQEEFAKMEKIINETQREHTKAIVSLKQIERQLAWQKQNSAEMIKEKDEIHQLEVNKFKHKAYDLEKERNILLTTIKQESIRVPKLSHVELDTSLETEKEMIQERHVRPKKSRQKQGKKDGSQSGKSKQKPNDLDQAKLSDMLKELQTISASLLEEDQPSRGTKEQNNNNATSGEL